jgi:hypothetical protein
MSQNVEQRHSPRVASRFWVAIDGVDDFLRLRRGNISTTGIYFETNKNVGQTGSVQWLYLAADEKAPPIELMARLIRTVRLDDLHQGVVAAGVALQFMPDSQETREALNLLLMDMQNRLGSDGAATAEWRGLVPVMAPPEGQVLRVLLETSFAMTEGEEIEVEIQSGSLARGLAFTGRAERVTSLPQGDGRPGFLVELAGSSRPMKRRGSSPHTPGVDVDDAETVHLLFSDLMGSPIDEIAISQAKQLTGELSRIRLPGLLSFLELERMSGELHLLREGRSARLYIQAGRILDVVAEPPFSTIRAGLAELVEWNQGTFEFAFGEVNRPDKIGTTVTALLIEIAHSHDEGR